MSGAKDMNGVRRPLLRGVLFLALGLGELVRILVLALIGASRLAAAAAGALGAGAWLLVYLAPHAVIASAFLYMVEASAASAALARLVIPAKLLGALASAAAIATELASGSAGVVSLASMAFALPQWLLLAGVAAWDLLVLAAALVLWLPSLSTPSGAREQGPPATGAAASPANPVYREVDVEVVKDTERDDS